MPKTELIGHSAGRLSVHASTLTLIDCIVRDCKAAHGAAMLVDDGSNVTVVRSTFAHNQALTGGALQVLARALHPRPANSRISHVGRCHSPTDLCQPWSPVLLR
eukprot:3586027-Prymnesium_polylepis.2